MDKITKHDPEFNQERLTEWDKGYNAAVEKSQVDIFYAYTKGIKHGREVEKREMREACGELNEDKLAFEIFVAMQGGQREIAKERWTAKHYSTIAKANASLITHALAQAYREGELTG